MMYLFTFIYGKKSTNDGGPYSSISLCSLFSLCHLIYGWNRQRRKRQNTDPLKSGANLLLTFTLKMFSPKLFLSDNYSIQDFSIYPPPCYNHFRNTKSSLVKGGYLQGLCTTQITISQVNNPSQSGKCGCILPSSEFSSVFWNCMQISWSVLASWIIFKEKNVLVPHMLGNTARGPLNLFKKKLIHSENHKKNSFLNFLLFCRVFFFFFGDLYCVIYMEIRAVWINSNRWRDVIQLFLNESLVREKIC